MQSEPPRSIMALSGNESSRLSWLPRKRYGVLLISAGLLVATGLVHAALAATNTYPSPSVPSWLDTGSNAWMLTAATLVGLMSLPGLAIFYGGLAKKRFVVNTLFIIFYAYAAVLVVWLLFGYNFGFGPAGLKIGDYGILGIPSPALQGGFEGSQAMIGPLQVPINIP